MTPLRDLIDIPERVHRDEFVLRLAEGVAKPAETLPIKSALASSLSKAAYLHGSFSNVNASWRKPTSQSKQITCCGLLDPNSIVDFPIRRGNPRHLKQGPIQTHRRRAEAGICTEDFTRAPGSSPAPVPRSSPRRSP